MTDFRSRRVFALLAVAVASLGYAAATRAPTTRERSAGSGLFAPDSALVGRILLAEDRRDSTDGALAEGERHADPRVRALARRARGRIRDPRFAARDSFPALRAAVEWPEPAWRLRFR